MNAKDAIAAALKSVGITQKEAAAKIGLNPQQINGRITKGTLRADAFLELMDSIGVDVTFTNRATGKAIRLPVEGVGHRVRAMVDRVIYDTAEADALANNFFADGQNEYSDGMAMELYIDRESGRYFFVCYSNLEGVKDRIVPVSASDAASFIVKYGTSPHENKTEPAEPKE